MSAPVAEVHTFDTSHGWGAKMFVQLNRITSVAWRVVTMRSRLTKAKKVFKEVEGVLTVVIGALS